MYVVLGICFPELIYVSLFTEDKCGLASVDLVFVVDASTSVKEENFRKQLEFMKTIVTSADIDSGIRLFCDKHALKAAMCKE